MVDESTNTLVISHLVIFATFVEEGLSCFNFLSLLFMANGHKDKKVIYKKLISFFKRIETRH